MKLKEKIITALWCLLVLSLFFVNFVTNKLIIGASEVYKIYLDGKAIGYITNEDELRIKECFINPGPIYKRIKFASRGHVDRHDKRSSHITVKVTDNKEVK